eukprot:1245986-Rhodomonas_salina.1
MAMSGTDAVGVLYQRSDVRVRDATGARATEVLAGLPPSSSRSDCQFCIAIVCTAIKAVSYPMLLHYNTTGVALGLLASAALSVPILAQIAEFALVPPDYTYQPAAIFTAIGV